MFSPFESPLPNFKGKTARSVTSRFITVRNSPQSVTGGPHSHKATTRPSDVLCFWVIHLWVSPDSLCVVVPSVIRIQRHVFWARDFLMGLVLSPPCPSPSSPAPPLSLRVQTTLVGQLCTARTGAPGCHPRLALGARGPVGLQ